MKHIHLVGRRGPGQAACTIKEFRELTKLPGCRVIVDANDVKAAWNRASEYLTFLPNHGNCPFYLHSREEVSKRPRKRLYDLMMEHVAPSDVENCNSADKNIYFRFLLSPSGFEASSTGEASHLGHVVFDRTELEGQPGAQRAALTGERYAIKAGLCFKSVGYKTLQFPGLPHDGKRFVIPSKAGRVVADGKVVPGIYVAGWAKRGPSGKTNCPTSLLLRFDFIRAFVLKRYCRL